MTEWSVVGVFVTLLGIGAVVIPPIIKLTNSITRLTTLINGMSEDISDLTAKNAQGHDRIWEHNKEQDRTLNDHERRLCHLETDERGKEK